MNTPDTVLPVGCVVHVTGYPAETARVLGYGPCPDGCGRPAYTVRREPGCFPTWSSDVGTWHAESTQPDYIAGLLLDLAEQHAGGYGDDSELVRFLRLLASSSSSLRADTLRFALLPLEQRQAELDVVDDKSSD